MSEGTFYYVAKFERMQPKKYSNLGRMGRKKQKQVNFVALFSLLKLNYTEKQLLELQYITQHCFFQDFTIQVLFRHVWDDDRLAYADSGHTGADQIEAIEGEGWLEDVIWTPNIYFVNEKESDHFDLIKKNVFLAILPNGTVSYNYRLVCYVVFTLALRRSSM